MKVRLENSVEFVKGKSNTAKLLCGEEMALIGVSTDGEAIYDSRVFFSEHVEAPGRVILFRSFKVKGQADLMARLGGELSKEALLLDLEAVDLSDACVGVTVSGRPVYDMLHLRTLVCGAGLDWDKSLEALASDIAACHDPAKPLIATFAPPVRDFYGRTAVIDEAPGYLKASRFPDKVFCHYPVDEECLVGITSGGIPVYDAQGVVPRICAKKNYPIKRVIWDLSEKDACYILPSYSGEFDGTSLRGNAILFASSYNEPDSKLRGVITVHGERD